MRNMKKLLNLLGAVSLTTVATISIVACGADKVKNMDTQIQKDFEFLDLQGKSLIKLLIFIKSDTKLLQWKSDNLIGITADKLLKNGGISAKSKSTDSANFLVNVLKLKAESGEGKDRIFKHSDANAINLIVKEYLPIINKKSDNSDYVVTGGIVKIKFEKDNKQLGDDYSLNILESPNDGVVSSVLPLASNITLTDFNAITGFSTGQPKVAFPVGKDLTQYFKIDDSEGKIVKNIVDFIKQGVLKIKVSEAAQGAGTFDVGNSIKIKISIGDIQFKTEYTLNIPNK